MSPVPKLMDQGSLLKKLALTSTTLVRSRSLRNVVLPLTTRAMGTWYRMLASRRTSWPSIWSGTTGSEPQPSNIAESLASENAKPVIGSMEIWSITERRTILRWSSSDIVMPFQFVWPTTLSERLVWLIRLLVMARLTSAVSPGARSSS